VVEAAGCSAVIAVHRSETVWPTLQMGQNELGVLQRFRQEAQLPPSDREMRLVSSNLANYHATVQKLFYDKS